MEAENSIRGEKGILIKNSNQKTLEGREKIREATKTLKEKMDQEIYALGVEVMLGKLGIK